MAATVQPALDASAHWSAIKALLADTVGDDVYDYGKVPGADGNPGTLPTAFVMLSVDRRFIPSGWLSGRTSATGWRVFCHHVGNTAPNARTVGNWVTAALNEARITVDGIASTPITHETTDPVAVDDGMFSGQSTWTYAL